MKFLTEAQKAKRRRKNAKRKLARRLCAAGWAMPPVQGLSKEEFIRLTGGTPEEYNAYADAFIAAAKKARRRWEFPLESVAVPLKRARTGRKSA